MRIVFDIGGTNTRVAGSIDGKTLGQPVIYPTPQDFSEGIQRLADTAKQLTGNSPMEGIAGGVPGPMDKDHTQLLTAPNIKDWNNKPLKKELERILRTKAYLENDTAMWGLGEAAFGAGAGKEIVVYITVSTGVGGTRIVHGNIDTNILGFEPGHQTIDVSNASLCGCGGNGHLEAVIGGNAMEKKYGMPPKDIHDAAVWDDVSRTLAIGLLNTSVFWSPNIIILGGSMMKSVPLSKVKSYMEELNHILPQLPEVELSTLGETGGLIGALVRLQGVS